MTRAGVVFACAVVLVAGCSVPVDDTAQVIDQDELPEVLQRVSTTTTPVTVPPEAERVVDYHLIRQPPDGGQKVVEVFPLTVVDSGRLEVFLRPMFEDDFTPADSDLINQLPAFDLVDIDRHDSPVATVTLEVPEGLPVPEDIILIDVAAQLVWTLTDFDTVDSVLVEIDGNPFPLPTTNDEVGSVDRPVDRTDYEKYDPEFVAPTTTTATTTTTTAPPTTTVVPTSTAGG